MLNRALFVLFTACFLLVLEPLSGMAQRHHYRPFAANVIVPQARRYPIGRPATINITRIVVKTVIKEQIATTTMDIHLENPGNSIQESEIIMPVPDGAVVRGFTFKGAGKEPSAELLPADEAKRIYDSIVATMRDPALLQFVGFNLVRSSVFPVEPYGTQQVRLTYEHLLLADGDRVDYVLPRSEALDYSVPWEITTEIYSRKKISTVYSPSHEVDVDRDDARFQTATVIERDACKSGPFRLSYLLEKGGVSASIFAFPDRDAGGGFFLYLAGLPAHIEKEAAEVIDREVTLVIDRSGSMAGEKMEQVRAAARQVLYGLEDGEAFNLIVYNEGVDVYADAPVTKSRDTVKKALGWLDSMNANGGTNIHDALVEALRMPTRDGMLPIVLFMTDGLPTIGQTSEVSIRDMVVDSNETNRRVFTFGVGVDVNTPLLEAIATDTRAIATFVMPQEDVELKVAAVFRKLAGPVLSAPALRILDEEGDKARGRVSDLIPQPLPDLFAGDQLVLLGQYKGKGRLVLEISGNYLGEHKSFRTGFNLRKASTTNSFVPRLWASRKIGALVDEIRRAGADLTSPADRQRIARDPRFKELVDEIVRLSTRYGILTEYTAFLAREGSELARSEVLRLANDNFVQKAMKVRTGVASVSQSVNNRYRAAQKQLNPGNDYYDENMERVSVTSVQQVADRAYFKRGNRWVDSRLVNKPQAAPKRKVQFGSRAYMDLADDLAEEGRQGAIALDGEILLDVDGESVLIYE
jgi:Ca-activated chloride channel homolog